MVQNKKSNPSSSPSEVVQVWCQEIWGISCYIDEVGNIYSAEDIISKKSSISKVGKYKKEKEVYEFVDEELYKKYMSFNAIETPKCV
jgi:hypothetical protein